MNSGVGNSAAGNAGVGNSAAGSSAGDDATPIPPVSGPASGLTSPSHVPSDPAPALDAADPSSPLPPMTKKPMRPIGPAALKALREAIRSGAYPSEAVVRDGIERLIRRSE